MNSDSSDTLILPRLLSEFEHHVYELGYERIEKCLSLLNEEEIYFKPNQVSNSIANLIVHLCGNLRQWIMTTFGGQEDTRNRSDEFALNNYATGKEGLLHLVSQTNKETQSVIQKIDSSCMIKKYAVQNFHVDGVYIICHVMEHYSYHVGQITYITKMITDQKTHYYDDTKL